ncbi:ribonuclease H, partial [Tanacetum coccineum]
MFILNLARRNVYVPSLDCPLCDQGEEDTSHLFFGCSVAKEMMKLICRWWDLDYQLVESYEEWFAWFKSIRLEAKSKDVLEVSCRSRFLERVLSDGASVENIQDLMMKSILVHSTSLGGGSGPDGRWVEEHDEVCNLVSGYFSELFSSSSPQDCESAVNDIDRSLTDDERQALERRVLPRNTNKTLVTLIPKVSKPESLKDLRPISLCNFSTGLRKQTDGRKGALALKIDMSKAYDRVEWPFIRAVLSKFGFPSHFSNLIMACVSSVSFSFNINGQVSGHVTPTRGLRQGDPISPYIFVMCAEVLSSMVRKSISEGHIHGVKVCRGAPEISHIANVDIHIRTRIIECLNVREVGHQDKYLGLPSVIGRFKKVVFEAILDKIKKKLGGWKEKTLSIAEKEVLIKSVAQVMPMYIMNIFLLPGNLIDDIHKSLNVYWWGTGLKKTRFGGVSGKECIWDCLIDHFSQSKEWNIGNGRSVNLWNDFWVDDHRSLGPKPNNCDVDQVRNLLNVEGDGWNRELPPGGRFSCRSAYLLALEANEDM